MARDFPERNKQSASGESRADPMPLPAEQMIFALPVEVRRCRRNPRRLVVVSATGDVLLRTLKDGRREQDIAERFARAMNEWAADPKRLRPERYGLSTLKQEAEQ